MKIKTYLLLIILIPVFMAVCFSVIMTTQNQKRDELFDRESNLSLLERDTTKIFDNQKQYYSAAKLIITNQSVGTTQLIALQRRPISSRIESLSDNPESDQFSQQIRRLTSLFEAFGNAIESHTEKNLTQPQGSEQKSQADYQVVYTELADQLQSLIVDMSAEKAIAKTTADRVDRQYWRLSIIFPMIFILSTCLLWLWTYRRLSLPIQQLDTMAFNFDDNELTHIDRGPIEVQALSHSFCTLSNRLFYQANHDSLTKLYNRLAFNRILREIVETQANADNTHALCFIDLDHFKVINDTCGHAAGDALLHELAVLMLNNVREQDTVARLGGDEFTILFKDCSIELARQLTEKVRLAIRVYEFYWGEEKFHVSSSFGLSEFIPKNNDATSALNLADLACMHAKKTGRNSIADSAHPTHGQLITFASGLSLNDIRDALKHDLFVLYKQAIVQGADNESNRGVHFEILLRMRNKELGKPDLTPAAFMPVVERFGLFLELDRWVIRSTIDWLLSEPDRLNTVRLCSINLSGNSVCNSDMLLFIESQLTRIDGLGHKLCFEITETEAINDFDYATELVSKLKSFGCYVALDDFGSGLSSFSYLKNLNIDFVKVDGCFVKDMLTKPSDRATVQAILDVARAYNKKTVAEFVETEAIAKTLIDMGADFLQGYYFDKPAPVDALTAHKPHTQLSNNNARSPR